MSGSLALFAGAAELIENTDYTVDYTTPSGVVTVLGSPLPAPTSWTGEYDILASFDTDELLLAAEDIEFFMARELTITEERA